VLNSPIETTLSEAASPSSLQLRVSGAILEAAARVLAADGGEASMADVASAAGVARATVYRYFPNREALLDALARRAVEDAGQRLSAARLDGVPLREGVSRAVRAFIDVGEPFVVLARERVRPDDGGFERAVIRPVCELFERGQAERAVRGDAPPRWLAESLVALVAGTLLAPPHAGKEDTIAAVTELFLDGAAPPEG
jgi:TetR/AcrR family transcriptional regulator, mexCD-oprJ operon repressor